MAANDEFLNQIRSIAVVSGFLVSPTLGAFSEIDVERLRAGSVCERCDLSGFEFPRKASLAGAWLVGANLSGSSLEGADLRGANLSGVDLRGANLRDARLKDANLTGAKLGGAELRGVKFKRVILNGADLSGATGFDSAKVEFACNAVFPDGSTSTKGCRF